MTTVLVQIYIEQILSSCREQVRPTCAKTDKHPRILLISFHHQSCNHLPASEWFRCDLWHESRKSSVGETRYLVKVGHVSCWCKGETGLQCEYINGLVMEEFNLYNTSLMFFTNHINARSVCEPPYRWLGCPGSLGQGHRGSTLTLTKPAMSITEDSAQYCKWGKSLQADVQTNKLTDLKQYIFIYLFLPYNKNLIISIAPF